MAFRGFFALDGVEFVNSSRVAAHVGSTDPVSDVGILGADADCSLTETSEGSGLYVIPASSEEVADGLWSPPDGSRLYDPGLFVVGDCWESSPLCGCLMQIGYDDSWPGLADMLEDTVYRLELAPWYSTRIPESAEFGGVWVLDVKGLDSTPISRPVTEMVGDGAAATGPMRRPSRTVTFDAVLVACSNAGLTYGLQWLRCLLADTNDRTDAVMRYLAAHPGDTAVDPADLVREVYGVILTRGPEINDATQHGGAPHRQATMYKVQWDLTVLQPYAYFPAVDVLVEWDSIASESIRWVHAAQCTQPASCEAMPVLFSADCIPEQVPVVTSPPPSCGGCLPLCEIETRTFALSKVDYPVRCRETAVSVVVNNTGAVPLTVQAYWRVCNSDQRCDDNQFPLQVSGLPAGAMVVLDAAAGRFFAVVDGKRRRPVGIVSTPSGAPWRPPILDRSRCWELVVMSEPDADYEVSLTVADREP